MSNPLALVPLALAAGRGHAGPSLDERFEAQQLVAAGLTLLQRSAPLVRALAGRRSMILLPPSPLFLTALAASDGRGAVLCGTHESADEILHRCRDADVGAVFTLEALAGLLPPHLPAVFLDDAPRSAHLVTADRTQIVDLGTHHGLALEGERDVPGRDEEIVVVRHAGVSRAVTHRDLLGDARGAAAALAYVEGDRVLCLAPFDDLVALTVGLAAPLVAGASVTATDELPPLRRILRDASVVVASAEQFAALLRHADAESAAAMEERALKLCICVGAPPAEELSAEWETLTGVPLSTGSLRAPH